MASEYEYESLRRQVAEYKMMYKNTLSQLESVSQKMQLEELINDQYRTFFMKKREYCNWMRDHNAQFEAFKASPYYIEPSRVDVKRHLD